MNEAIGCTQLIDKQEAEVLTNSTGAEDAVKYLLQWIGENPYREGLQATPRRVAKAYKELFSGYSQSPEEALGTFFEDVAGYQDPVLLRDIEFYSYCEHHILPILGRAHIAYIPDGRVVGLSKIIRLVDVFAHRLQTQEALTAQIASNLMKYLKPKGVAVLIEAEHMCMALRGVQKRGSTTITTGFLGEYADDSAQRNMFLQFVNKPGL